MSAELDIPVFINLSNRNIILHDDIWQLHSIFKGMNINHGQSYLIFGFWLKKIYNKNVHSNAFAECFISYGFILCQKVKMFMLTRLIFNTILVIFDKNVIQFTCYLLLFLELIDFYSYHLFHI